MQIYILYETVFPMQCIEVAKEEEEEVASCSVLCSVCPRYFFFFNPIKKRNPFYENFER